MIYYYIIGQGSFTGEEEEEETHDERVSKVEERAGESCNLELSDVEVDTIDEEVDSGESTRHQRPPPPVIVLTDTTATDISVTETIAETEISDPTLTETMVIVETEII